MVVAEAQRLYEYRRQESNWRSWGPYLSERAWGTVREDYSAAGDAWNYFNHAQSRSRAYRWGEDGLAGISDRNQYLCFALALWNEKDSILKERLFGLSGPQGNHGEDVKEVYFYLDNTPTHSYMKMLYKYPQLAFPYAELITENHRRGYHEPEYELVDTGIFDGNRYFDVQVEYAKASPDDICIRISITNHAELPAPCHVLPTLWFRNTWTWGYAQGPMNDVPQRPNMRLIHKDGNLATVQANHVAAGQYHWYIQTPSDVLFTENDTNTQLLYGYPNVIPFVKDAFHRHLIYGEPYAVNPDNVGSKAAAYYPLMVNAGETITLQLRLVKGQNDQPFEDFDAVFEQRMQEADEFYDVIQVKKLSDEDRSIQRQAFAGLLWTKQLYYYDIEQWLKGDPWLPGEPYQRKRNKDWQHLTNFDIISMPDKWEYPWYATWDLAFHTIPLVMIDPDFAKRQLELITREWYMHPNGQIPAYEWNFSDVNPPVPVWAVWRVYNIDKQLTGDADRSFLESMFHKLMLNFTWWVNRKDEDGNNVFEGGFLGLDNISIFNRSESLPGGSRIEQSDATAWMAFYSIEMMRIALELAIENSVYEDMAVKFFEHFMRIAHAMTQRNVSMWDAEDGFFYDVIHLDGGLTIPLKVRSLVGLLPLIAVEIFDTSRAHQFSTFTQRARWFIENRPNISNIYTDLNVENKNDYRLVSILSPEKMRSILRYMLDENEFLSDYGIRSLSRAHRENPYEFVLNGKKHELRYLSGESDNGMFGGNSNWRGPIWFPMNYLLIEALQKYHRYYGDDFKIEFPTGSGNEVTLDVVAAEIGKRLVKLFERDENGKRPANGGQPYFDTDENWRDHVLFYEYFDGDNGRGLGASHQTGWTALVARLIQSFGSPDSMRDLH